MSPPTDTVLVIGGSPYKLTWDKAAMFRAEDAGVFDRSHDGVGFAKAVKYVWSMGPQGLRDKYASPEQLAYDIPPIAEVWPKIQKAIDDAGDALSPKNVIGSMNGPSPSSS